MGAVVDVAGLAARLARLESAHGQALELLGVATRREKEARALAGEREKERDDAVAERDAARHDAAAAAEAGAAADAGHAQRVAELEAALEASQRKVEELETTRRKREAAADEDKSSLGGKYHACCDELRRVSAASAETEDRLTRLLRDCERHRDTLKGELEKVTGMMDKSGSIIGSLHRELDDARHALSRSKDELRSEGERLVEVKTRLRQSQVTCGGLERVVDEYKAKLEAASARASELDAAQAEASKRHEHLAQENRRLEQLAEYLRGLSERASLGNGRSNFGDFVEMKKQNERLRGSLKTAKRQLSRKAVAGAGHKSSFPGREAGGGSRRPRHDLLAISDTPQAVAVSVDYGTDEERREPLKMPAIVQNRCGGGIINNNNNNSNDSDDNGNSSLMVEDPTSVFWSDDDGCMLPVKPNTSIFF